MYKFFDKLRSSDILSHEDYEEIDNSTVYPTGVEKAGVYRCHIFVILTFTQAKER